MDKIGFLFSGQGAQYAGMGKAWYDSDAEIKELFDAAEAIRPGTLEIMFSGTEEQLKTTSNTQPALYLADLAAAIAAKKAGLDPAAAAGFSLGEIPALAFAGAYSYTDGFKLACRRGEFMQKASEKVTASMAAIVKLTHETVEELCSHYGSVYPVNYNCPGQLVVSGVPEQLEKFYEEVKTAGGRALPLKVGGGFHSPFMNDASALFGSELENYSFNSTEIPAYSNRTAEIYGENYKTLLTEQINHPVKWEKIIKKMAESGVTVFIETGVGSVLTKLMPKILPECRAFACSSPEELEKILTELK